MKSFSLLLLIVLCLSFSLFGQTVQIYKKQSDKLISDRINSFTEEMIFGQQNSYFYPGLQAILFYQKPDTSLTKILRENSIDIVDRYSSSEFQEELSKINRQLMGQDEKQKKIGKALQIVGSGLLSTSLIVATLKTDENLTVDRRKLSHGLAIIGGTALTVGFIIR